MSKTNKKIKTHLLIVNISTACRIKRMFSVENPQAFSYSNFYSIILALLGCEPQTKCADNPHVDGVTKDRGLPLTLIERITYPMFLFVKIKILSHQWWHKIVKFINWIEMVGIIIIEKF